MGSRGRRPLLWSCWRSRTRRPTVIGAGQRLFGDNTFDLDLARTTAFGDGVLYVVYTPVGQLATGGR
ncbi:hypothetical protein [Fodinicola acaciae]|uniref:hypothetical protein n=1 Tax=Fodinicola acaciae TaxID=2681555 RepID=UPI0013D53D69|nr:hypothetical protein [Fodinicola acaciae]